MMAFSEEMNLLGQTLGCEIKPVERWFRLKIQTERRKSKEVDENPPKIAESEKTEEESEIISTAVSKKLFYGGPILRWDGKVVGQVTAEEVRKYF